MSTSPRATSSGVNSPKRHSSPGVPNAIRKSSQASSDHGRKRIEKACDRCRMKKCKCDGSKPCSKCKADNVVCSFGRLSKPRDRVYPKGYVEMLEQQQRQLVLGLRELYRRMQEKHVWAGSELTEINGHPLTHDILSALNLLHLEPSSPEAFEDFEEDSKRVKSEMHATEVEHIPDAPIDHNTEESCDVPLDESTLQAWAEANADIWNQWLTTERSSTPQQDYTHVQDEQFSMTLAPPSVLEQLAGMYRPHYAEPNMNEEHIYTASNRLGQSPEPLNTSSKWTQNSDFDFSEYLKAWAGLDDTPRYSQGPESCGYDAQQSGFLDQSGSYQQPLVNL